MSNILMLTTTNVALRILSTPFQRNNAQQSLKLSTIFNCVNCDNFLS